MKLMYLIWGYSYDTAIIQAFEEAGLKVEPITLSEELFRKEEVSETTGTERKQTEEAEQATASLRERLRTAAGDIVFSVNFFAAVSGLCQEEAIPYCSWVLQLPNFDLYTTAVRNSCNYLGICDSYLLEKLWQIGVEKAFFLPDAVAPTEAQRPDRIEREACFVGRYPESRLDTQGMTAYGKGYLDAFLHTQRVVYGAYILENCLLQRVQNEFVKGHPIPMNVLPELHKLYTADRYFAPASTRLQQDIFLQNYASIMTIYSNEEFPGCASEKRPYVEDEDRRREIYAGKEFTLVLAHHVLHNGIPRDLLEVIAAGGFPLAGFQKDYTYFFKKDESLAFFTNSSEFSAAIVRYGNSSEERERVRAEAYRTVMTGHTYPQRVITMLEMWAKL